MKYVLSLLILFHLSCSPSPEDIQYGSDMCQFCQMSIVDRQHAAELVTNKGKVFKFDAIECMINYIKDKPESQFSFILCNDFDQPGILIDATKAGFLISKAIPSPMGAYLSAFNDRESAQALRDTKGGEIYDWDAVIDLITSKRKTNSTHSLTIQ